MKNTTKKFATVSLLMLAAALPAAAQSEISPDHFDDAPGTTMSASAAALPSDGMTAQIAAEEAKLKGYETQITEKERQMQDDLNAANLFPGDEAGQMIAYSAHEKECNQLRASLAPKMQETREAIARLKGGNTVAAKQSTDKREPILMARAK